MLTKEDKSNLSKIKKLLKQRAYDKIQLGLDLIQSLDQSILYDELLKNVALDMGWNNIVGQGRDLPFTHDWGGSGPDQHYIGRSILGLINYSPAGSIGETLRNQIERIELNGIIKSNTNREYSSVNLTYLSNFQQLKSLKIKNYETILGFDSIYSLPLEEIELTQGVTLPEISTKWSFKSLKKIKLNPEGSGWGVSGKKENFLKNLKFISTLTTLECLSIEAPSYGEKLEVTIDGIEQLKNLSYLSIQNTGIETIDQLRSVKQLVYLKINERYLSDIKGIEASSGIVEIDLSGCENLTDISPLKNQKHLLKINVDGTAISSLSGLENSSELLDLSFKNTKVEDLDKLEPLENLLLVKSTGNVHLQSIKGLINSKKLIGIDLSNSCYYDYEGNLADEGKLETIEGLENSHNLRQINLSKTSIKNLDPLINANIFNNKYGGGIENQWVNDLNDTSLNDLIDFESAQNSPFDFTSELPKRYKIKSYCFSYFDKSRTYYPDRSYSEPTLNEMIIEDCHKLETIEGLKNSSIDILKLKNCPQIKDVAYLSEFKSLKTIDFENCKNLSSVAALSQLSIDRLFLGKCYKVKPKPRFLKMDTQEKALEYLSKFNKEKKTTISLDKSQIELKKKIEQLVLSDNYGEINLGIELSSSISDAEIFDAMLEGIKYNGEKILPNSLFLSGTKKLNELRQYALESLVSVSPEECTTTKDIKAKISHKKIEGSNIETLLCVSGYSNLETLEIENTSITSITDLSRLKNLKKIVLTENKSLQSLLGLKNLPLLEEIEISCKSAFNFSASIKDMNGVSNLKCLKKLTVKNCNTLKTLEGLNKLDNIESISIKNCSALLTIDSLKELNSVKAIKLVECEKIQSIECLNGLPNLELLDVRLHNFTEINQLGNLIKPLLEGQRRGNYTY